MTPPRISLALALRTALAVCLLVLGATLSAAEGGFSATLSPDQQAAAGLSALATAERAALDQFVAAELARARQGNVPAWSGTFASRLSEAERQLAGLNRLNPTELAKLNELVAAALTARPKPKERPRLKDDDVISAKIKPEIHGEVSLTYGWGRGGRNYRAASLWLDYFDPNTGLGIGVGLTDFSGDGCFGYYPGAYGSGYYSPGPVYYGTPYRNVLRDDFPYGSGQSFRASLSRDFEGRGYRRH